MKTAENDEDIKEKSNGFGIGFCHPLIIGGLS